MGTKSVSRTREVRLVQGHWWQLVQPVWYSEQGVFARIFARFQREASVFVTVHTPHTMAQDLRRKRPALAESRRLQQIVSDFGLRLEATHPETSDQELASQFYLSVPDPKTAAEIRRRIEESGIVDAVYVKPPEGPP